MHGLRTARYASHNGAVEWKGAVERDLWNVAPRCRRATIATNGNPMAVDGIQWQWQRMAAVDGRPRHQMALGGDGTHIVRRESGAVVEAVAQPALSKRRYGARRSEVASSSVVYSVVARSRGGHSVVVKGAVLPSVARPQLGIRGWHGEAWSLRTRAQGSARACTSRLSAFASS